MAKSEVKDGVVLTPLRSQVGEYGVARPYKPVTVSRDLAKKLLRNKLCWAEGVVKRPKSNKKAQA